MVRKLDNEQTAKILEYKAEVSRKCDEARIDYRATCLRYARGKRIEEARAAYASLCGQIDAIDEILTIIGY